MSSLKTGMLVWQDAAGEFHARWRCNVKKIESPKLTANAQKVECIDFAKVAFTSDAAAAILLDLFIHSLTPDQPSEIRDLAERVMVCALYPEGTESRFPSCGFWYFVTQLNNGYHSIDLHWEDKPLRHSFDEADGTIHHYLFILEEDDQRFMQAAYGFCNYFGKHPVEDLLIDLFRMGLTIRDHL